MTYTDDNPRNIALTLPITQAARQTAEQFARLQPTPTRSEQVRLNTLAVHVVNDYLQMMGIATNLAASDSWQPVMQLCANTADLDINGVGRLECRPLNGSTRSPETCPVPPEVWGDRIGYVVVHIDEAYQEATLLGFVETAAIEELPLVDLNPPEALLDHLDYLLHPASNTASVGQSIRQETERTLTNLGQWFRNNIEAGWQPVDAFFSSSETQLAYGFRGDLERAESSDMLRRVKSINLGSQTTLALLIELQSLSEPVQETRIRLQVHPIGDQPHLPPNVQLTILDETDRVFLEAQSRESDNYIQLTFSGQPSETFQARICLGEAVVTENFEI